MKRKKLIDTEHMSELSFSILSGAHIPSKYSTHPSLKAIGDKFNESLLNIAINGKQDAPSEFSKCIKAMEESTRKALELLTKQESEVFVNELQLQLAAYTLNCETLCNKHFETERKMDNLMTCLNNISSWQDISENASKYGLYSQNDITKNEIKIKKNIKKDMNEVDIKYKKNNKLCVYFAENFAERIVKVRGIITDMVISSELFIDLINRKKHSLHTSITSSHMSQRLNHEFSKVLDPEKKYESLYGTFLRVLYESIEIICSGCASDQQFNAIEYLLGFLMGLHSITMIRPKSPQTVRSRLTGMDFSGMGLYKERDIEPVAVMVLKGDKNAKKIEKKHRTIVLNELRYMMLEWQKRQGDKLKESGHLIPLGILVAGTKVQVLIAEAMDMDFVVVHKIFDDDLTVGHDNIEGWIRVIAVLTCWSYNVAYLIKGHKRDHVTSAYCQRLDKIVIKGTKKKQDTNESSN